MKVKDIIEKLQLKVLAGSEGLENEAAGVYISDLLSWVMSNGNKGNVWITVQAHPNIIAVASLLEFSCIIVPEDVEIEEITVEKANGENIPILQSNESGYELCSKLKELGL